MTKLYTFILLLFITIPFVTLASDSETKNKNIYSLEVDGSIAQQQNKISDWDKEFYADIEKRFGKQAVVEMKESKRLNKIIDLVVYFFAIILFICGIVGVGLNKKMNKIHTKLCLLVLFLAIVFSIYSVGYAGEQGAIGLIFVALGIGVSCLAITIVLWIMQFYNGINSD